VIPTCPLRVLNYLYETDVQRYRSLIQRFGLRR
jgi:ribosomal protein S15P/S13E